MTAELGESSTAIHRRNNSQSEPLIMKEMVKHVVDAGSYPPVTILIEERPDNVRISYDRMASQLAPYGKSDALKVARELDAKVERILAAAAK